MPTLAIVGLGPSDSSLLTGGRARALATLPSDRRHRELVERHFVADDLQRPPTTKERHIDHEKDLG